LVVPLQKWAVLRQTLEDLFVHAGVVGALLAILLGPEELDLLVELLGLTGFHLVRPVPHRRILPPLRRIVVVEVVLLELSCQPLQLVPLLLMLSLQSLILQTFVFFYGSFRSHQLDKVPTFHSVFHPRAPIFNLSAVVGDGAFEALLEVLGVGVREVQLALEVLLLIHQGVEVLPLPQRLIVEFHVGLIDELVFGAVHEEAVVLGLRPNVQVLIVPLHVPRHHLRSLRRSKVQSDILSELVLLV